MSTGCYLRETRVCRLQKLHCVSSAPSCSRQRCALTRSGCSAMLLWRLSCTKPSWHFLRTSPRSSGACKVHSWCPSFSVEPVEFAAMQSCRMPVSYGLLTMTHTPKLQQSKRSASASDAGCGEPCSGGGLQHVPHWSAGQEWLRGQPVVCLGPCQCRIQSCAHSCCAYCSIWPSIKALSGAPLNRFISL